MTNIQAINLLKGLEQSLDDYCELNDEGKTAFRMAITALEVFENSEQLPSAQPEIIRCKDCIHYTPLGKDKVWGRCSVHSSPTENQRMCQSCDFCSWAERRTDD